MTMAVDKAGLKEVLYILYIEVFIHKKNKKINVQSFIKAD